MTHPLSLIFGFCVFDTEWNFPDKSILDLLSFSIDASIKAVMFSITDGYIYGNYAFLVGTVSFTLLVVNKLVNAIFLFT